MIKRLTLLLFLMVAPGLTSAQEGSSGLAGLLERSLSSDRLQVSIEGLEGALSSQAQIARLTFSDPDGPWLIITDAVLDWQRTALLRGRVEVRALTARRIEVLRTPAPAETDPLEQTASRSFRLPELPVSVRIDQLAVDTLILEEPIIGERIEAKFNGSLSLIDGAGDFKLDLERSDITGSSIALDLSYDNATTNLRTDISVQETEGGLLSRRMGIPDAQSLDFTLTGSGPITNFTADLALSSDDALRFGGDIRLLQPADETSPRSLIFTADLSGDVRPMIQPDLRPFFGGNALISLAGALGKDGSVELEDLVIDTAALDTRGALEIGPNGWPVFFDLTTTIASDDGERVQLPVGGAPSTIAGAEFEISYDSRESSIWALEAAVDDYEKDGTVLERITLDADGTIILPQEAEIGSVQGDLAANVAGLGLPDPALSQALGSDFDLTTDFTWPQGGPLTLDPLAISGAGLSVDAAVSLAQLRQGGVLDLIALIDSSDISRFSGLAGQQLGGAGEFDIAVTANLAEGSFDAQITGTGRNLQTGIAAIDPLLAGAARLSLDVGRDEQGVRIGLAEVVSPAVSLRANGQLSPEQTSLTADGRLSNLGLLVEGLPGAVTFEGEVAGSDGPLNVSANLAGPAGIQVRVGGTMSNDFSTAALTLNGTSRLELVNPFISPRVASGALSFNLGVNGPLEPASVSGNLSLSGARIAAPTVSVAVEQLNGSASINGTALQFQATGTSAQRGQVIVDGGLNLSGDLPADIGVEFRTFGYRNGATVDTSIFGNVSIQGDLVRQATISGRIGLNETEIRISDIPPTGNDLIGQISHFGDSPQARITRERAGLSDDGPTVARAEAAQSPFNLNITVFAPNRIFVRGRGLDAELGGELTVQGNASNIQAIGAFQLERGRFTILGTRLDLDEGSAQLSGSFIPDIRFVATSRRSDITVSAIIEGPATEPDIRFTSVPQVPEDEAVAQLLFGRSITNLSGFQALQLADALLALQGSGSGVFQRLRDELGLDDLDVAADEEGGATLRVGKYISDNTYTDVEVGSDGGAEVSLNIDLTPSVTARGSVGADGSSGIGLFFERDY